MKRIRVAIAIVKDGNEVLVAKRSVKQHQGGLWEFPGGKVEDDESYLQAALRELAEEVGVKAEMGKRFWQVEHDYGDRVVLIEAFLVTQWQGKPYSKEGNPVKWVALDEISELPMPEANAPLLAQLAATVLL